MATPIKKKITALVQNAKTKGHWPLAAAAQMALTDETNVDHQINVLGAMHEHAFLRNRLKPFWDAWQEHSDARILRGIERIAKSDYDYWAVASFLGMDIKSLHSILIKSGWKWLSTYRYETFNTPEIYMNVYVLNESQEPGNPRRIWSPVVEVGCDSKTGEIFDVIRWRAIILNHSEIVDDSVIGSGSGSYFLSAKLPYGSWRIMNEKFDLKREKIVPRKLTLLG